MPNAVDTGAMNQAQSGAIAAEAAHLPSLQGKEYTFNSDQDRIEGLDAAFDYRGDLTLRLRDGSTIDGFVFNREPKAKPPVVQLFVKGEDAPRFLPYVDIVGVAFTGKDPADGKSYLAWKAKKHGERQAEAQQIESDLREKGYL
jgi:hypothetical protein